MPSKHIDAELWEMVQAKTVEAVTYTKKPIKDTEMLKYLIINGLSHIKLEELPLYVSFANGGKDGGASDEKDNSE